MKEKTQIIFKNNKLYISSNLKVIFNFLIEINYEVESLLETKNKLEAIRTQHLETLDFVMYLANKLKENNIEFKYELKEHPEKFAEKLEYDIPNRSLLIVLFALLETHRVIWKSYQLCTSDEGILRDASNKEIDGFIKEFCLNSSNEWYQKNSKRSGKISVKMLRELRNSLTHFFSVSKLGILNQFDKRAERLMKQTNNKFQAITPQDLYEIIESAMMLMLKKWSDDYIENDALFLKKIYNTKKVVEEKGAVIVKNLKI